MGGHASSSVVRTEQLLSGEPTTTRPSACGRYRVEERRVPTRLGGVVCGEQRRTAAPEPTVEDPFGRADRGRTKELGCEHGELAVVSVLFFDPVTRLRAGPMFDLRFVCAVASSAV